MAMGSKNYRTYYSTLLLIILACQSIYNVSASWGMKHKGTIKTIQSEDGEMIDCVDIYQQPGLENRPKTDLKMSPTSLPAGMEMNSNAIEIQQVWQKYGECPEGTIPIRRSSSSSSIEHRRFPSVTTIQNKSNHSNKVSYNLGGTLEYAMASKYGGYSFYGAYASLNLWNPRVEYGELSANMTRLSAPVSSKELLTSSNSIESGWIVYPSRYKDNKTRVYIYWTSDGSQKTGCYDLDCPGFIQTSRAYTLGAAIGPISSYGGANYGLTFGIFQDKSTGEWWLRLRNQLIGYWPSNLFTTINKSATLVNWGGVVLNRKPGGRHTTTQMGNGHFPVEGFEKSTLISYMTIINSNHVLKDPGLLEATTTRKECYDAQISKNIGQTGHVMYFGGPGYSSTCT